MGTKTFELRVYAPGCENVRRCASQGSLAEKGKCRVETPESSRMLAPQLTAWDPSTCRNAVSIAPVGDSSNQTAVVLKSPPANLLDP